MMKVTEGPVQYPDKFKVGDIAIAKKYVKFMYGEEHRVGQEIVVTEDNKAYYNVCYKDYDKKIS